MKRFFKLALAAGVAAITLYGCIFSPSKVPPDKPPNAYREPTSPDSVLENLQVAYRRKEIEPYAKLLAPEFIFKFIPTDVQDLGLEKDFWTRDQDSTGTGNLFRTNQVSAIRIELTHLPAYPTNDLSFPPGTMQIHVNQTQLEVDEVSGTTWLVTEQQDMFFRKGLESAGEDTTHWFLMEWHDLDLSGGAAPQPPTLGASAGVGSDQVRQVTMGELLSRGPGALAP
jgi:hypothetical protein